jgi:hypothetical protein
VITADERHWAVYADGADLIAVRVAGWVDLAAVVLPSTGGSVVIAESGPGFLGLWRRPKEPRPARIVTPELLASRPGLAHEITVCRDAKRDLGASLRARFPQVPTGGTLRFSEVLP